MSIFHVVILAVVQALTEFLPVSSTAHLYIINYIFNTEGLDLSLATILHGGTLFALIYNFYPDLFNYRKNPSMLYKIVISTIPPVIVGSLLLFSGIKELGNIIVISISLITIGILFIFWRFIKQKNTISLDNMSYKNALVIGIFESLAFISGTSRSGVTIFGGYLNGLSFRDSLKYSFIIGIPITFLAFTHGVITIGSNIQDFNIIYLLIGFLVSFLIGNIVIKYMLRSLDINNIKYFGYYRIMLGILILFM
jgi:undecaprenyl-diphosphatase